MASSGSDTPVRRIAPEKVARLAYRLWEERGRGDGRDVEDWLRAERMLQQGYSAA